MLEEGQQRIGKKLSGDEVKAGLDALFGDGGVDGALAAMERVFQGGTKLRNGYEFGKLSVDSEEIQRKALQAAGSKAEAVSKLDGSRFSNVKDIESFLDSMPADAARWHWVASDNIPEGVDKFIWTDSSGNQWFAECHGPDASVMPGKNAYTGWVYRIKVRINGSGNPFYLASDGKFYAKKMMVEGKKYYVESLANDTHIPINGR